jgi:hypothetical protein
MKFLIILVVLASCAKREEAEAESQEKQAKVARALEICAKNYNELCCMAFKDELRMWGGNVSGAMNDTRCMQGTSQRSSGGISPLGAAALGVGAGYLLSK